MDVLRKNGYGVEIGDTFFRLLLLQSAGVRLYIWAFFFLKAVSAKKTFVYFQCVGIEAEIS